MINKNKSFRKVNERNIDRQIDNGSPSFCFKYLMLENVKKCRKAEFFKKFLERLKNIGSFSWHEIKHMQKHGHGVVKMNIKCFKPIIKNKLTPDVKCLDVFRALGNNQVFLGTREGNVFKVRFIETEFNQFYNHSK